MQFLILGLVALVLFLVAAHRFTMANPAVLARQLRAGAGVVVLAGAGVLLVRGMAGAAMSLAALGAWLLWGHGGLPWPGSGGAGAAADGQTSRIVTDHFEAVLDHDSGDIRGRVRKGFFKGRALETLAPVELAHLWQDCRFTDPPSAQVLEAYLDRVHPSWREDMAREEAQAPRGNDGRMTREEAAEILGVTPDAGEEEVQRAHRALMLKLHPDRGGSTYLAAKINEAKDVLLRR
ncbi:MAG: DnaJ domain-containing protein [Hyphomicrobiaceae bacterium]|jgi:hypothetical protein